MKTDNYVPKQDRKEVSERKIKILKMVSKIAICTGTLMYIFFIPQIIANFQGRPGSPIQYAMATLNGAVWTWYGWNKTYRDWPVILSNFPGVIFGGFTLITCIWHP